MPAKRCVLLLLLLSTHGLAQVTFLTQPQNATVVEGGDATIQCAAEENGMALQFVWDYTPKGGMLTTVISGTSVAGVSMVTVSSDRTQLTLSGVQREVDGATVVCTAFASTTEVGSNPATISVQWPPTVNSGESITLQVGDSYPSLSVNFTEGNPRSTMTITGPSQPGNSRVSISSNGVVNINGVSRDDAGTHTATWRNDAGSATFTLDLDVNAPNGGGPKGLSTGAIAAMVVCSLVFMALGN